MIKDENPTTTIYLMGIDYRRWACAHFIYRDLEAMTFMISSFLILFINWNSLQKQTLEC